MKEKKIKIFLADSSHLSHVHPSQLRRFRNFEELEITNLVSGIWICLSGEKITSNSEVISKGSLSKLFLI